MCYVDLCGRNYLIMQLLLELCNVIGGVLLHCVGVCKLSNCIVGSLLCPCIHLVVVKEMILLLRRLCKRRCILTLMYHFGIMGNGLDVGELGSTCI